MSPVSHGLHQLRVVLGRVALGTIGWGGPSVVGAHGVATGAKVTPALIWGSLWGARVALSATSVHLGPLRALSRGLRVGHTPEGGTLALTSAPRRPWVFLVLSGGPLVVVLGPSKVRVVARVSSRRALVVAAPALPPPLLLLPLPPLLLPLLPLELCVEVFLLEVVLRKLVPREGRPLLLPPALLLLPPPLLWLSLAPHQASLRDAKVREGEQAGNNKNKEQTSECPHLELHGHGVLSSAATLIGKFVLSPSFPITIST